MYKKIEENLGKTSNFRSMGLESKSEVIKESKESSPKTMSKEKEVQGEKNKMSSMSRKSTCLDTIFENYKNAVNKSGTYPDTLCSGCKNVPRDERLRRFSTNTPVSKEVQIGRCNLCNTRATDIQYTCLVCPNIIFCEKCESVSRHPHPLLKARVQNGSITQAMAVSQGTGKFLSKSHETRLENSGRKSASPIEERKVNYRVEFTSNLENESLEVIGGEQYDYNLMIKNSGEEKWPNKVKLVCINGVYKGQVKNVSSLKSKEEC